tara:strand:+ start:1289 stop:2002 length:714 start_codon:yes stop_codon:yes gene_type:complete
MNEENVTEEAVTEETSQQEEQSSERPEWLPEKFNSPEDMAKSYTSLSTKLGEKEEEVRERLMSELSEQASEGVPTNVGDYELPDYLNEEEAIESETLKSWADHCFENGYTHEEFKKGIDMYMSAFPDDADLEAESERLGDNSESRIEAASLFANQFFPEETIPAIERMFESAEGVIAMEAIMEALKDPSVSDQTNISSNFNEVELQEMQRDERYWNPAKRDNNFVNQVNDGYKKLYG